MRREAARFEGEALTDPLTGLPNRRRLERYITAVVTRGDRVVIGVCDLDGFKPGNDELGHAAGDLLLVEVAARLRATVRTSDLVARLGGDEFVVLCPGADPTSLDGLADRVRTAVTAPYHLGAGTARVGISIGVHLALPGASPDEVLTAADRRMYAVKRAPAT